MGILTRRSIPAKAANALDVLGWITIVMSFINLLIGTFSNIMGLFAK